ncbi:MAG TPA: YbjN domain-containing protein [Parvularculaceae bacterium]|nr:YbjN domain-containing protein [Parvularculaceae bacterium]
MVRVSALIAVFLLASGAPAFAQSKSALTAAEIEAVLSDAGLTVRMIEEARTGAPVAHVALDNVQYWVRALDCSGAPKACSTLVFFANFSLGRDAKPSDYEIVNRFNDSQVFGRAYVIPGKNEVGVDYVIELDGGVSMENVSRNVARWADVINAFISHFSKGQQTS